MTLLSLQATQHVFIIRRNNEITRMNPCKLITYFCQYSVIRLDTENGDAVRFQAITGIQEFAVRTDMNITTAFAQTVSATMVWISFKSPSLYSEGYYCTRQSSLIR